jgi:hypothetical protein
MKKRLINRVKCSRKIKKTFKKLVAGNWLGYDHEQQEEQFP